MLYRCTINTISRGHNVDETAAPRLSLLLYTLTITCVNIPCDRIHNNIIITQNAPSCVYDHNNIIIIQWRFPQYNIIMHARCEYSRRTHARPPMRWCNNYVVTQSSSRKPQDIISTRIKWRCRGVIIITGLCFVWFFLLLMRCHYRWRVADLITYNLFGGFSSSGVVLSNTFSTLLSDFRVFKDRVRDGYYYERLNKIRTIDKHNNIFFSYYHF